jgi:hypothetical protein
MYNYLENKNNLLGVIYIDSQKTIMLILTIIKFILVLTSYMFFLINIDVQSIKNLITIKKTLIDPNILY